MKIARIKFEDMVTYAAVEEDGFRLLDGDVFGDWEPGNETIPRSEARLLAPVTPAQTVAIGLNYRGHAVESNMELPDHPLLFVKTCNTTTGPGGPILLPKMAPDEVDYEAELVIVIGKHAKHVPEDAADEVILGYTCGNDVSARDCQIRYDGQWARGKSFDTFAPLGPWIETEVDADNLDIQLTLNGNVMQKSSTSDLIFNCRQLVSFISQCMTLLPGSIIMTGTPSGVGFTRKPPVYLQAGDTVTVEIEGIGTLTNPVQREG